MLAVQALAAPISILLCSYVRHMETTNDLHAVLVNASVTAERAFQVAVSDKYVNHPELHRHTWATATIIQRDILRYLITLE